MEVSGNMLLGVMGMIFTGICILVGVVHRLWDRRITRNEEEVKEKEERYQEDKKESRDTAHRIFDKVDATNQTVNDLALKVAENVVTKEDCAERRRELRNGRRPASPGPSS